MTTPFSSGALRVSSIALGALLALALAGCNDGVKVSAPLATFTPAANCVVDSAEDVVVGPGTSARPGCADVELEPSPAITAYGAIVVKTGGTLEIGESQSSTTEEHQICVDGGKVITYRKAATSKNKITLEFVGDRNYNPPGQQNKCELQDKFKKGIDVLAGTLELEGAKGVPSTGGVSWTTLAAPAGSQVPGAKAKSMGDKTLYLTANVTQPKGEGWQTGDWIVVATTDYNPLHSEFVQIKNVEPGGINGAGSTVTLSQPLVYYHFGSLAPSSATASCPDPLYPTDATAPATQPAFLCDGASRNWGVDERAEVGLISRDLTLTAQTEPPPATPPASPTSSVYWGGEIKIHTGFTKVVIQGVRLSKFGKDKLGSYPIHFHRVGTIGQLPNPRNQTALIDADSVDHSYNKCVTIHATSNLTISNMVCARIVGQIFYEELNSAIPATTNNPADDLVTFNHDLGIGAMSNSFDVYAAKDINGNSYTRQDMIDEYWWPGDYMTNDQCATYKSCINYDGFNVPDTDNWLQATHGMCVGPSFQGRYEGLLPPDRKAGATAACPPSNPNDSAYSTYVEAAGGFWIQNPGTVLTDNAIAGCQGVGTAFWWGTPNVPITVNNVNNVDMKSIPLGKFENNRASSCYNGFFGEENYTAVGGQLAPRQGGKTSGPRIITTFDGVTATHIRFRGLWMRGSWYVIKNGHFATNRESISLITSGGVDGNAPGDWHMLTDSVLLGESRNNVGRWGPCPTENAFGVGTGLQWGCIASSYPASGTAHSADVLGEGYPDPHWNSFGYMLYDGPVRVFHDRFVNFNYNEGWSKSMACNQSGQPSTGALYRELDDADCTDLKTWENTHGSPTSPAPPPPYQAAPTPYEGDAAFGWFQGNQSAYPTGTESKQLMWVNTNLRHQIYTDLVNIAPFNDGDKNTAIIDEDGTLSGFGVKAGYKTPHPVHPASLNNLPFNATSNAVDECFSRGAQNQKNEGRDSSLMSPANMGILEFSNLYPYVGVNAGTHFPGEFNTHYQYVTFTRTDKIDNGNGGKYRPSMTLKSRDGQGIWEPKVSNGYGYTVRFAPIPNPTPPIPTKLNPDWAGAGPWLDVGLADIVDPNISKAHPFYIRLGIDYKSLTNGGAVNPTPNANDFVVERGFKSYAGGTYKTDDPELANYFTALPCKNLDGRNPQVNQPTEFGGQGLCPSAYDGTGAPIPVTTMTPAGSIAGLTVDGTPNGKPVINKYYYDPNTGYLWLNLVQEEPNAVGPSPMGSCSITYDGGNPNPACPHWKATNPESYYVCPQYGCIIYTITLNDPNYAPGPSTGQPLAANLMPAPPDENKLKLVYPQSAPAMGTVVAPVYETDNQGMVYAQPSSTTEPACDVTQHDAGG